MWLAAGVLVAVMLILLAGFMRYAPRWPARFLRPIGWAMVGSSTLETVMIAWLLVWVATSDGASLASNLDTFWRDQLSAIYFIKEWLYTWLWNDLLDLMLVVLPAIAYLTARTVASSWLAWWTLRLARSAT